MNKILLISLFSLFLVGCSTSQSLVIDRAIEEVEEVADEVVDRAENITCKRLSVRAMLDKYGHRLCDWSNFCYPNRDLFGCGK